MAVGTAVLDFGTRDIEAKVTVTGQTNILTTSKVEAFLQLVDNTGVDGTGVTGGHTADEMWLEGDNITLLVGDIVAGASFVIYAKCRDGFTNGKWRVNWVGNYT